METTRRRFKASIEAAGFPLNNRLLQVHAKASGSLRHSWRYDIRAAGSAELLTILKSKGAEVMGKRISALSFSRTDPRAA